MGSRLKTLFAGLLDVEKHERLKVLLLTLTFFLIVGAYTVAKELKDSIFISIVGKDYVPVAKWLTMLIFIIPILIYSKLVDKLRRYQLLSFLSAFFGCIGLIFALLIGHQVIGLPNTNSSPFRIFGWLFYFFVEGYAPFLVSVFWAFANSITSPDEAKKNYGLMVAGSKIGGMLTAGLAWALFSMQMNPANRLEQDVFNHQIVFGLTSLMLIIVPFVILSLMKKVPGKYLHGYEAAYQIEKQKSKLEKADTGALANFLNLFSGLFLLLRYPYVLGIFAMGFFYEIVYTVLSFLRLGVAQSHSVTISGVSIFLLQIAFIAHFVGLIISLFGTRELLKRLGERVCLLLIPLLSGLVIFYFMITATPYALVVAFVALRAINYAFSWPVRESLYIPTVKEIKFKSKSWVDAFGSKFAKTSGSAFNMLTRHVGQTMLLPVHSFFFAFVIGVWFVAAYILGKRFEWAVEHNEVIGAEEAEE
jgi:AAA family ATP:ADP antiporter